MKPLNYNEPGCDFTTSNCVIWQGPDIPCLNLCKGDSVSDVVYKAGMEICSILDTLNIQNYEAALSCLNLTGCAPSNFQDLINLIISQLCNLNTGLAGGKVIGSTASGESMAISECYYYTDPFGDTIKTMTVEEYAKTLGARLCSLITTVQIQQTSINDLTNRVSALEVAPTPVLVLPTLTPECIGPDPLPLDQFTALLETSFCDLQAKTGAPADIFANIQKACNISSLPTLANPGSNYNSLTGWTSAVANLAESFGNLWLLACDIRAAVLNIQTNCCPSGCDGITLSLVVTSDETSLLINVSGTVPPGFLQCAGTTQITLVDGNGVTVTANIDLSIYLNSIYYYSLATSPLNTATPITVTMNPCYTDGTTTCESCLTYVYTGTAFCPEFTIELNETETGVNWSIIVTTAGIYTVQLFNSIDVLVNSTGAFYNPGTYTGSFTSLTPGVYSLNVVATVGGITNTCPESEITIPTPPLT